MDNRIDTVTAEFPWRKNLYILWTAQFIAMIGMSACVPFLPLYVRELGVKDVIAAQWWSGLIYSAPFFVSVFITPIWGALGDRYSRKFMVIRALFGLMLAMMLMGFVQNVWQLFFLRCLQGAISGFIASNLALVSASTPKKYSGYAIGFIQTSVSAGATTGPLFGGLISDSMGIRSVFFLVAILCLASQVIIIMGVQEKRTLQSDKTTMLQHIHELWHNHNLRNFLLLITLCQTGLVFPSPIFAYYVESLHAPKEYLGTITGIMIGIVGFLTTIFGPIWGTRTDKLGYQKTLLLTMPLICIATFSQALVSHYVYLFPCRILIGIFSAGMVPTLYAILNKNSPEHMQGIIMGFASSATMLGNLIGPITCPAVSANFGMSWAFVTGGFLLAIGYIQVLCGLRGGHNLLENCSSQNLQEAITTSPNIQRV